MAPMQDELALQDRFVPKPYSPGALVRCIESLIVAR
jgi:hypothetical protein